jgi:hypothetical protein
MMAGAPPGKRKSCAPTWHPDDRTGDENVAVRPPSIGHVSAQEILEPVQSLPRCQYALCGNCHSSRFIAARSLSIFAPVGGGWMLVSFSRPFALGP